MFVERIQGLWIEKILEFLKHITASDFSGKLSGKILNQRSWKYFRDETGLIQGIYFSKYFKGKQPTSKSHPKISNCQFYGQ